jgi:phosphoribosyl 1,2-cyclic phosphodiesterase
VRVTFYGVRGSVPTPGPSTVRYGGNTSCVEVRLADGSLIVLDGGTGIRELGKKLIQDCFTDRIHLLVTHPHLDHIIGLPFFGPIYRKETHVVLYPFGSRRADRWSRPIVFDGEHFPVQFAELPLRLEYVHSDGDEVRIGSASVRRIRLNHPGGSNGFRIDDEDGASLCYMTDNELDPPGMVNASPTDLARFALGTNLLIHDAQFLPSDLPAKKGWGHSLVGEVLELGRDAEARGVAVFHHDPERDDDAMDRIGVDAARWARAHAPAMQTFVAREGLTLEVSSRGATIHHRVARSVVRQRDSERGALGQRPA